MIRKRFVLLSYLIFVLWVGGCATVPSKPTAKEEILKDICAQYDVEWQWDSVSQVVTLNRHGLKAKALVGSNLVIVENDKVFLSSPIKRKKDLVLVPPDFKEKVIDRLTKEFVTPFAARKFKEIMLDPGHGGKDPGAISGSGVQEKTVVLDIAKRIRKNLEAKGIKITMTRDKDIFIPLEERSQMAHKTKADLFISIHANSSRARTAHGFEVYYLRDLDRATKADVYQKSNYRDLYGHYAMEKDIPALNEIIFDMLHTYKQAESKRLAEYLTKDTANFINSTNRGSVSAGFSVLKHTLIPAVLVEVGFLSNKSEEGLLKTDAYRQKIADGITRSILEYDTQ